MLQRTTIETLDSSVFETTHLIILMTPENVVNYAKLAIDFGMEEPSVQRVLVLLDEEGWNKVTPLAFAYSLPALNDFVARMERLDDYFDGSHTQLISLLQRRRLIRGFNPEVELTLEYLRNRFMAEGSDIAVY